MTKKKILFVKYHDSIVIQDQFSAEEMNYVIKIILIIPVDSKHFLQK